MHASPSLAVSSATSGVRRAFAALPLPPEVRAALDRTRDTLQQSGARVGWLGVADFHLTLCFFGDADGARVEALRALTEAAAAASRPFRFDVAGLGVFGPPRAPRVVWAGVPDPPPELADLANRLRALARSAGFPVEARPYRPHITLGRVRDRAAGLALTSAMRSLISNRYGNVPADRVLLMSAVEPTAAARYRTLHEAALKGNGYGRQVRARPG